VDAPIENDLAWLLNDNEHPAQYYLRLEIDLDETEFLKEDYSPGTTLLLDRIEEQWYQYVTSLCLDYKNVLDWNYRANACQVLLVYYRERSNEDNRTKENVQKCIPPTVERLFRLAVESTTR